MKSIPFVLGADSSSITIPSGTNFGVTLSGTLDGEKIGLVSNYKSLPGLTFEFQPLGPGVMRISGGMKAKLDGNDVEVTIAATAESPLLNRPPVADPGPDRSLSGQCPFFVNLDGSASNDPDGNLKALRWVWRGALFAEGPTASLPITASGQQLVTLVASDTYGGESRAEVRLNAECVP